MFLFSFQCIGVRDFADCLDLGCLLFSAFRSLVGRADDRFSLGKWCQMQCGRPRLLSCNSLWTKIYRSKSSDWWTKLRLENFVSSENSNWPSKFHLEIWMVPFVISMLLMTNHGREMLWRFIILSSILFKLSLGSFIDGIYSSGCIDSALASNLHCWVFVFIAPFNCFATPNWMVWPSMSCLYIAGA